MLVSNPALAAGLCLVGGYFLGSIPFGFIATRLGGAGDIRKVGSGSIGATNVLRTGRRDLAAITLVGDGSKGAAAVLLAGWLLGSTEMAALAGGKGLATAAGVMFAIAWPAALLAGAVWLAMALIFRISSLASLTAAAVCPL